MLADVFNCYLVQSNGLKFANAMRTEHLEPRSHVSVQDEVAFEVYRFLSLVSDSRNSKRNVFVGDLGHVCLGRIVGARHARLLSHDVTRSLIEFVKSQNIRIGQMSPE